MPNDSNYLAISLRLLDDLTVLVPEYTVKDSVHDAQTIIKRVRSEGMEFCTKTLPLLGKHLDDAFQVGSFKPFPSLKKERGRTTPKFLGPLFKQVFSESGILLANPSPEAVGYIRQVCYFLYKLESEYSPEVTQAVINQFVATDDELKSYDSRISELRPIIWRARAILEEVFADFDPADIIPRPGPGASASGSHKSQRYEPLTLFDQVHQVYPYYKYFYTGTDHLLDRVNAYRSIPRKGHASSRLRVVPKDSRGPRIICMEEQEVMFLQQGLADAMRRRISHHPLTAGQVNFFDQSINQRLACVSSLEAVKATLDMKEASDRISRLLVADLFQNLPLLSRALLALSTPEIILPDGSVMKTNKYAPMGSSLCFPVMSIVHFALGVACLQVHTTKSRRALAKSFYVYGDDIIVDAVDADLLFELFPKFGLVFNRGKSFVRGPFRESCGFDAFLGKNVTPQRIKKRFFDDHAPRNICAALDIEHHLYERGFRSTAEYLRTVLDHRFQKVKLPFVGKGSKVIGWIRSSSDEVEGSHLQHRYNRKLQSTTIRAMVLQTKPEASMLGGWEQLMRSLTGTLKGSQELDGRYSTYDIRWAVVPVNTLYGSPIETPLLRGLKRFAA